MQPTQVNQKVKFSQPLNEQEESLVMIVLEMRGDRCLVEAQVDMKILPTMVYLV